jgi:hypothetical protein
MDTVNVLRRPAGGRFLSAQTQTDEPRWRCPNLGSDAWQFPHCTFVPDSESSARRNGGLSSSLSVRSFDKVELKPRQYYRSEGVCNIVAFLSRAHQKSAKHVSTLKHARATKKTPLDCTNVTETRNIRTNMPTYKITRLSKSLQHASNV